MNEPTENGGPAVRPPGTTTDGVSGGVPEGLSGGVPDGAVSTGACDAAAGPAAAGGTEALPELLELDLETLRTLDHPVLRALVAELRDRAEQPRETLWGFTNAF